MILVTGGTGFIGSHLVQRLVERGERVRILDNFSTGKHQNIAAVSEAVELQEGDLRSERDVERAVAGAELVFHQAALPSVPRSIMDPKSTFDVNVTGTLNVLVAARDAGCRRLVFASSSSVYGDTQVSPKVETMATNPLSPYAVSKMTGEHLCRVFTHVYGLETVSLRYFNVFGPGQDPNSPYAAVIPKFLRALISGEPPTIYGDGKQSRDFCFVENVVRANIAAGGAVGAAGRVFNIAGGQAVRIDTMLESIMRRLELHIEPRYEEPRPGDIRDSRGDITAAQQHLGYRVHVPFEEGLRRTVDAFVRDNPSLCSATSPKHDIEGVAT